MNINKVVLALVFWCSAASWGGQSLVIDGTGSVMTFSDPNIANTLDWRVEFQIHGFTAPASASYAISFNGVGVDVQAQTNGNLWLIPKRDSVTGGSPFIFSMTGRANTVFRLQRDYAGLIYTCEAWEADGSKYEFQSREITSVNSWAFNGGQINETNLSHRLGFLRLASTRVAINSRPPVTADTGDLLELKFDGNGNDSSGNGRNLSSVAGVTFASTPGQVASSLPATPATPAWANFIPLRAGHPSQLTSYSYSMADASSDVTCLWQQIEGPSWAVFDNRSSCTPTLTGLVFGSYVFRLAVTDSAGQTGVSDFDVGAVAYDDNGVVIYPDDRLNDMIGPEMARGRNPWEWADERQTGLTIERAKLFSVNDGPQSVPNLKSDFNGTPIEGTVWWSSSGYPRDVYGVGTNFLDVFCKGSVGAADPAGQWAVFDVPTANWGGSPGVPRPLAATVNSCASDTQINVTPYLEADRGVTVASPGVRYGVYWNQPPDIGAWNATGGYNVMFYDTAMAYYREYYRSGDIIAKRAAEYLAANQFRNPYYAQWVSLFEPTTSTILAATLTPEIFNGKDPWPMILSRISGCTGSIQANGITDQREGAYCIWATALAATYHPDSDTRASLRAVLKNHYDAQASHFRLANGGFYSFYPNRNDTGHIWTAANGSDEMELYSGADIDANYCGTAFKPGGTVSVDGTGYVLTGTSTDFTGSAGKYIVLTGTKGGQPLLVVSQVKSTPTPTATSVTLVYPWTGATGTLSGWQIRDSGYPVQMFESVTSANAVKNPREIDMDTAYACTVIGARKIKLHRTYTGNTSSGNVYRRVVALDMYTFTPWFRQPFMDGLRASAYTQAAKAMDEGEPTYAGYFRGIVTDLTRLLYTGRNLKSNGQDYFTDAPTCKVRDNEDTPTICDGEITTCGSKRDYTMESVFGMGMNYLYTRDSSDLARGDETYKWLYAKSGWDAPVAGDGCSVKYPYEAMGGARDKALGQAFGHGGGSTWPAARLGGPAPAEIRTVKVSVKLDDVVNATQLRVTCQQPWGASVTATSGTMPVSVTGDFRAGSASCSLEYLSASDAVLASTSQAVIVQ